MTTRAAIRIAALFFLSGSAESTHAGVIPLPASITPGAGSCEVNASTRLLVPRGDGSSKAAADYLAGLWRRTNALRLQVVAGAPSAASPGICRIVFQRTEGTGDEGYRIEVSPQEIIVAAGTAVGLFYGAVTLWQLLPPGIPGGAIAAQTIVDSPRYAWRGLMLDSARHFQSTAFIRSMIDWMAWHKLNVLHWHLTDDQGWRLQIRRYPKLTSVGAWRGSGGNRYGGYYTQAEVAGIVRFAAQRHVQIIPEIDMPGHATAAIAAYPWLGSSGEPLKVSEKWGVHQHLFNLEPRTFEFLDAVLDEVMQLFPSRYVHVGGDEAVKDEWNASKEIQARARELGIPDSAALQAYFTRRMARYLEAHGRRLVGWDEILTPGMPNSAVVMSWHGISGAHDAALAGNDAVLTPQPTLYFDRRQSALPNEPPGRLEISSLEAVYNFDPAVPGLSGPQQQHVLGMQANIWTEHIQNEQRVEWMTLPRAAALAEVAWSPPLSQSARNWSNFLRRLVPMFGRYSDFGLHYADSVFGISLEAFREPAPGSGNRNVGVKLSNLPELADANDSARVSIRYSIDASDPTPDSTVYATALDVTEGTELRAATFIDRQQVSRTLIKTIDRHTGRRRDSHELTLCSQQIGLLLEAANGKTSDGAPLAIDIMNPCWIYANVDISQPVDVSASVASIPFNYEIGKEAAAIKVGDARTPVGELQVHIDNCDSKVVATLPLPRTSVGTVTVLASQRISLVSHPGISGRHNLCLRFARPHLDPMWALNWFEIGE
jgi:hexosaminidase